MSDLMLDSSTNSTVSVRDKNTPSLVALFARQVARILVMLLAISLSTWLAAIAYVVVHSLVVSVAIGGIGFWLICWLLLKERIELLIGSSADTTNSTSATDAKYQLGKPIVDERTTYCQGRLPSSKASALKLIYCGPFTEEVQQFYRISVAFSFDAFPIQNPEYVSVYGLVDSKADRYMFLEAFAAGSSLERGYFHKVDQWPAFALYEIE